MNPGGDAGDAGVAVLAVLALLLGVLALVAGLAVVVLRRRNRALRRRVAALETALSELEAQQAAEAELPRPVRGAERALKTVVETVVKVRTQGVGGLVMSSFDELSRWAMEDRSEIMQRAVLDGRVTVFFSDIVGSTALNTTLGDEAWVRLLVAHDTQVRAQVERHDGHIVKSQGDGFMIVFPTPSDAVRAGTSIQRSLDGLLGRRGRPGAIKVRIGIHQGPAIARDDDLFGQTVATAARIGARADGGEILVSSTVAEELADDDRFTLAERPPVELKGLPGEHVLWRVERARRRG